MFKKLIANLPFNPGLIEETIAYGKTMHRETSLRKFSFWLLSLSTLAQAAIYFFGSKQPISVDSAWPLLIGFIMAVLSGFMYARSQIIALEVEIIRLSYVTNGAL